jgi:hypothetical protein
VSIAVAPAPATLLNLGFPSWSGVRNASAISKPCRSKQSILERTTKTRVNEGKHDQHDQDGDGQANSENPADHHQAARRSIGEF